MVDYHCHLEKGELSKEWADRFLQVCTDGESLNLGSASMPTSSRNWPPSTRAGGTFPIPLWVAGSGSGLRQ
jgi:hypothetical protein